MVYGQRPRTHEDQVLDVIKEYHYFAPAMLTRGDPAARHLSHAALVRGDDLAELMDGPVLPMRAVQMCLGALLIRLGAHLRGGHLGEPDTPPSIVAATSRTGG
jgi:hypothetical protein